MKNPSFLNWGFLFLSLWNRAMSYDKSVCSTVLLPRVSIPLEQGNLLRRKRVGKYGGASSSQSLWNRAMSYDQQSSTTKGHFGVSIPLEQGNVLRQNHLSCVPWRSGVSIPLEQGNVLRLIESITPNDYMLSQSLWNRAMSYDRNQFSILSQERMSQSLWNRAMSYDLKCNKQRKWPSCLNPFGTGQCLTTLISSQLALSIGVSIPLEQGNVLRQ